MAAMWIRSLGDRDDLGDLDDARDDADALARCGGKAAGLAALLAAGLPVPEGFVLTDDAFRAVIGAAGAAVTAAGRAAASASGSAPPTSSRLPASLTGGGGGLDLLGHALDHLAAAIEASAPPPALVAAVAARAQRLGRLAVRSSISLEDRGAGAAAGVFSSKLAVAPEHLWPAIRAVWASVCTPLAAAYARHRAVASGAEAADQAAGQADDLAVAVIVQRYVPGQRLTIYTRPPGQPRADEVWLERGAALRKLPRSEADPAVQLALRAERALGLEQGGADVELIEQPSGELMVVQARPIVHPALARKLPAPPLLVSALVADGRRWLADFAHNPDPLSPAQAGLIERIEREAAGPYSLRLCAGYLYTAPRWRDDAPPAASPSPPPSPSPVTAADLQLRFSAVEQRAAAALGEPTPDDLAATLETYLRFYRVWAFEMSPLVSTARRTAVALAKAEGPASLAPARAGSRRSAVEAIVLACARGELGEGELLARLGDLSPAWDVAVPTLAETPEWISTALARARARLAAAPFAASSSPPSSPATALADFTDLAFELAELDDVWFAHAQARVRRALLARGAALAIGADVFWLPLDDVLVADVDPEHARSRASAARAAHRRASAWRMPATVGGPADPSAASSSTSASAGSARWRGVGAGGIASGRVVHISTLWELPVLPMGAIAVTPAVTPALAVALVGAAAIVSETGGLLDHGAAMARELGIPCVVGCTDAMSLPPHALVTVDGEAGTVTIIEPT